MFFCGAVSWWGWPALAVQMPFDVHLGDLPQVLLATFAPRVRRQGLVLVGRRHDNAKWPRTTMRLATRYLYPGAAWTRGRTLPRGMPSP